MLLNLRREIKRSVRWRQANDLPTPQDVIDAAYKAAMPAEINADYHRRVSQALFDYLGGGNLVSARNDMKKAVADAFGDTFEIGWLDGGEHLPLESDASEWIGSRTEQEFGFVEMLFQQAKDLRKEKDFDASAWISERADGYVNTLQSIYNAGRLWAAKGKVLTWHLGNTEKHCKTCASLNGKAHRASWYLSRNYIPRNPGAAMECGGYQCDCYLTDKAGNEVTIGTDNA